jgi:hypothetical protein
MEVINPLSYLNDIIINLDNNNISDKELHVIVKQLLKYHSNIAYEQDLTKFDNVLKLYPFTITLIKDYYHIIKNQLVIIPFINKWKEIYHNKRFWKLNTFNMILHLHNLKNKVLYIFDGSKSTLYFHIKLRNSTTNLDQLEEIVSRLEELYKLFKYNFFINADIILLTFEQFEDIDYVKKIDYIEYLFIKITKLLDYYIWVFEKYEYYRFSLDKLINSTDYIIIECCDIDSDFDENQT